MEVLYTAEATATGGRKNGHAYSADGAIDVQINPPNEVGGSGEGTNPEQLFAAGYAACFDNPWPRSPASRSSTPARPPSPPWSPSPSTPREATASTSSSASPSPTSPATRPSPWSPRPTAAVPTPEPPAATSTSA